MARRTLAAVVALACAGPAYAQALKLESPDIKPNATLSEEQVFNGFGCAGKNISPALKWSGAPKGTKSFALLVHDPDAPTGGAGWWHWVVVNIPAEATELRKDAGKADGANLQKGAAQVNTDFGSPGWGGPCPPAGDKPHRYIFSLHALKVEKLDLPPTATASLAGFMVNANSLGKATLTGKYGRRNRGTVEPDDRGRATLNASRCARRPPSRRVGRAARRRARIAASPSAS